MKIIGVKLNKPVWLDFVMAAIAAVVVGLIGAAVSIENVSGLMLAAALVALVSVCGASHDKAGNRGLFLALVVAFIGMALGSFLF